jgi:integrase
MQVAGVRRRNLLAIRDEVAESSGAAAGNKLMRVVSALFAWVVDREWIEVNPVSRIKALAEGHLRPWSAAEYDRVLPQLPADLRRVFVLARHTGQRRSDLVAIRWSQYDGQAIRLTRQKTGKALVIPATPQLQAELAEWPRSEAAQILITARGQPCSAQRLTTRIRKTVAAIGPAFAGLNAHGLRKLAATTLAEAGCSEHEIAAITGHGTLAMVRLYTRSAR